MVESWCRFPVQAVTVDVMAAALSTRRRFGISYWDAAILEAGRALGCSVVLSEDLDHGTDYDGIRVEDPFRPPTPRVAGSPIGYSSSALSSSAGPQMDSRKGS